MIGIGGFIVGAIVAIVLHLRAPACEVPVDDVPWAAFRLDEIEASMKRVKKDEAWAGTRAAMEAYAATWASAYLRACELPEGDARETAYACVTDALGRADALLDALRLLDPEAIATAEATIASLPTCDHGSR